MLEMPNSKELTLAAARAIHYDKLGSWDESLCGLTDYEGWYFSPLTDNDSAFTLQVLLKLTVSYHDEFVAVRTNNSNWKEFRERCHKSDIFEAVRLALTRAAGAIS